MPAYNILILGAAYGALQLLREALDADKAIALMLAQPPMIRRPVLVGRLASR